MRLLIIDDEKPILDILKKVLTPGGHSCKLHDNPVKAVESFKKHTYDVVMTDINMPKMNGIEVLKAIRASDKKARVIIFTGYGDLETAIAAINNGAYAFFSKPINFKELMDTLKKIESELDEDKKREIDYSRLMEEYAKLRDAYSSLKTLIAKSDKNPENRQK